MERHSVCLAIALVVTRCLNLTNQSLASQTSWNFQREHSSDGCVYSDHLLRSFRARSRLDCVSSCVRMDGCVALTYWRNASQVTQSCRCHSAIPATLTQSVPAASAKLYVLSGFYQPHLQDTTTAGTTERTTLPDTTLPETTLGETTSQETTPPEATTVATVVGADLVMFSEAAKTGWNLARQYCEAAGMTLAKLDQASNSYIASLMGQSWYQTYGKLEFWVGLYDSDPSDASNSPSGYRWVSDCALLSEGTWVGWASGEPQNTVDSYCISLTKDTGEWRSFKCDSLFQFLCYTPKTVCNNVNLGYDAANEIHRNDCYSFRFDHTSYPNNPGSTSPDVTCSAP